MGYWSTPEWIKKNMSRADALIFSIIYNTSSTRGYFDASIKYLCEITELSRRSVQYHLRYLEETGAIEAIGRNSYKNFKYVPLLNEANISEWDFRKDAKVQKAQDKGAKGAKNQECNNCAPSCNNCAFEGAEFAPYKNINLNKTINKAIERSSIKDTTKKADAFSAEFGGAGRMIYKWYDEESYKKFDGWWKHYIFFEDDEELNDLFIKFLDKTAEENNNYSNGCRFWYDAINLARYACKYSDEYLIDLSDEEYDKLPDEDKYAHDVTDELKKLLREFAYNGARKELFEFIDLC